MLLHKKEILNLLAEETEALHFASLLRAFGGRHIKNELKRLIDDLVKSGEVVRLRGNRYTLPGADNTGSVQGTISIHRDGFGFVKPESGGDDIFIPGKNINNALHGDKVSVRAEKSRSQRGKLEGRVLAVLERSNQRIVGRLQQSKKGAILVPEELRLNSFFTVPGNAVNGAVDGQQVVIEVTAWPAGGRPPEGKVIEILGWPDDPDVEVQTVIRKFDLPHRFESTTLAEAEAVPSRISHDDLKDRVDLRKRPFVTIDGETAKDFDDAVAIAEEGNHFRLWVSIADVSHYVRPGTALDREAYLRGTSVYFPDRCIPMLPERLSNGICSLNPRADRLTMTAEMLFDRHGRMLTSDFYPSVISSAARLTYTTVRQVIVDDNPAALGDDRTLAPHLLQMKELALILMTMRRQRGSIDFDLPEPEIILSLTGQTEAIVRSERNLAHQLIEEFMLAANEAVARFVTAQTLPFIYRVHEQPDSAKLAAFRDFILPFGYSLTLQGDKVSPQAMQQLISEAAGKPEERLVNYGLLRCMKQARYAAENLAHFGLASPCYTHFTSPIRRYPDLLVHRLLKLALLLQADSQDKRARRDLEVIAASLSEAAEHTSTRERVAMEAERDIIELKKLQFMQGRIGQEFNGFIAGVAGFGFFVELAEVFVEGLVHISTLADDLYSFDEPNHRLVGRRTGRVLQIGDQVSVRVVAVNPQARRIEFVLQEQLSSRQSSSTDVQETAEYPRIPIKGKRPSPKRR
jgi:ribonuclease R